MWADVLFDKISQMIKSLFAFLHISFIDNFNIKLPLKNIVMLGTIISVSTTKQNSQFYNLIGYVRKTQKSNFYVSLITHYQM